MIRWKSAAFRSKFRMARPTAIITAPFDGSRPAIYWINLRDNANWPKYGLPDLTYHEGVPGHHLQLSYVRRAGNLPLLLRNTGNSAYTEGWALYAERVAYELGALPGLDEAGYLQSLLFRATRLVVDTGIHAKRWSREQATRYMMDTTGFVRGRSQSEIERYICMIGQACSYKIGHNVWVAQREKRKRRWAENSRWAGSMMCSRKASCRWPCWKSGSMNALPSGLKLNFSKQ
jgi:uncharacterized protein (DUF885 family)